MGDLHDEVVERALDLDLSLSRVGKIGRAVFTAELSTIGDPIEPKLKEGKTQKWVPARLELDIDGQKQELCLEPGVHDLGRNESDRIILPGDPTISRVHAVLTVHTDGRMTLRDVGSRNGTTINKCKMTPTEAYRLNLYDIIGIGEYSIKVLGFYLPE